MKTTLTSLTLLLFLVIPLQSKATLLLEQTSPNQVEYVFLTDFFTVTGSGEGMVTATAQAVDWELGIDNASTSGCESADFTSFVSGNIALIQRGACLFSDKVINAIDAGALGVILFNQGNTLNRNGLLNASLGSFASSIPVFFATYSVGITLDGTRVRMSVPEPTTISIAMLSIAGLFWRRLSK